MCIYSFWIYFSISINQHSKMSVPVAENHPEAVSNDLHLDIKDNYSNQLYQVYCGLGMADRVSWQSDQGVT